MAFVSGDGTVNLVFASTVDANLRYGAFSGSVSNSFSPNGNIISSPYLLQAAALTSTKIRVTFSQQMKKDSRIVDKNNYSITPALTGVVLYISSVSSENATFPNYVDLVVNEMTNSAGYQLVVNSGDGCPVNKYGIEINPGNNTYSFSGIGEKPTIQSIIAISKNRANVVFSENMLDNDAIREKDSYVFDNGLTVLGILDVYENVVELVTSDQVPGTLYNLTIG